MEKRKQANMSQLSFPDIYKNAPCNRMKKWLAGKSQQKAALVQTMLFTVYSASYAAQNDQQNYSSRWSIALFSEKKTTLVFS